MYTLKTVPGEVLDAFLSDIEQFEEHDCCIIGLRIGFIVETFAALVAAPEFALLDSDDRRELFEDHQRLNKLLEAVGKFGSAYICGLLEGTLVARC